MNNNDWNIPLKDKEKILKIIDFVKKEIPSELHKVVLKILLQFYLKESSLVAIPQTAILGQSDQGGLPTDKIDKDSLLKQFLQKPVEWFKYDKVFSKKGKNLDKSLLILSIGSENGLEWLTPSEVTVILKEKARVAGIYTTNISNALKDSRNLVDRRSRGIGYEYRLMRKGEDYVQKLLKEEDKNEYH